MPKLILFALAALYPLAGFAQIPDASNPTNNPNKPGYVIPSQQRMQQQMRTQQTQQQQEMDRQRQQQVSQQRQQLQEQIKNNTRRAGQQAQGE